MSSTDTLPKGLAGTAVAIMSKVIGVRNAEGRSTSIVIGRTSLRRFVERPGPVSVTIVSTFARHRQRTVKICT